MRQFDKGLAIFLVDVLANREKFTARLSSSSQLQLILSEILRHSWILLDVTKFSVGHVSRHRHHTYIYLLSWHLKRKLVRNLLYYSPRATLQIFTR